MKIYLDEHLEKIKKTKRLYENKYKKIPNSIEFTMEEFKIFEYLSKYDENDDMTTILGMTIIIVELDENIKTNAFKIAEEELFASIDKR